MKIKSSLLCAALFSLLGAQAFAATTHTKWACSKVNANLVGGFKYSMACTTSTGWLGEAHSTRTYCDVARKVVGPYPPQTQVRLPVNADSTCEIPAWKMKVHFDMATHTAVLKDEGHDTVVASCKVVASVDLSAAELEAEVDSSIN